MRKQIAAASLCAVMLLSACVSRHVKDTTIPTVASTTPSAGVTAVAVGAAITVVFSEAMDPATIDGASFTIVSGVTGSTVTGTVAYDAAINAATFTPSPVLSHDTPYTAAVSIAVKDLAGNSLGSPFSWSFRTVPAPGSLDATFGSAGRVKTSIGNDSGNAVAIQSDGKILVTGYSTVVTGVSGTFITTTDFMTIIRYLENGALDASFGLPPAYGKVSDFPGRAYTIAVQNDGKILAAGSTATSSFSNADFLIVRYNTDGQLDASFGVNGKAIQDMGFTRDEIHAIAVQGDGKIVTAGTGTNSAYTTVIARFEADGKTLDATFGAGGKVIDASNFSSRALLVKILPDGNILVGGTAEDAAGAKSYFITRYDQNGTPDQSFNLTSRQITTPAQNPVLAAIAVLPGGKILAAGTTTNSSNGTTDIFVARYLADGTPDTSFGTAGNGTMMTDFNNGNESAVDLEIQSDNKILVAANYRKATGPVLTNDFALFRYNEDGTADLTFGGGFGMVTTDFGSSFDDFSTSLKIQPDGKVVVAGISSNGPDFDFGICRYWP